MKVMLVISYDGSLFHGFQRQNNVKNVQSEVEEALTKFFSEEILVKGAGRTDAGVHAKYQVVHFETDKDIKGLKKYLKDNLEDIKVKKIKKVNDNFHARHSVKDKTYLYKIDLSGKRDSRYYGIVRNKLDIKKMQDASLIFLGSHDFRNFVAGERLDYKSTILNIHIYKIGSVIYLKFKGIGFYRYMVRNLVGSLIEVGKGKIDKSVIKEMLDNYDKEKRLPTASPNGLYLIKINY